MSTSYEWELYSNYDALSTFQVWEALQQEDTLQELWPWYELTQQLQEPLLFMMTHGLAIDVPRLRAERDRVNAKIEVALAELHAEVGFSLNPNSPKQCIGYFYGLLGHDPYLSKEGKPTSDDTAMARLARKGVKAAGMVQTIRGLQKLSGTYLEMEFDEDNRIRCSISATGTRTSRLSSSKTIYGTGGNMQNLPASVRAFIVPDEGHFFIEVDKAQAEWVLTAYISGEPNMIKAIELGIDIHSHTASRMFSVSIDDVKREDKLIGKTNDAELIKELRQKHMPHLLRLPHIPTSMSLRQAGKKINHGCNYRLKYRTFALKNEMTETEAKPLVEGYSTISYPGLPIWWSRVETTLRLTRKVTNVFGRSFYFYAGFDYKLGNDAIATNPQSSQVEVLNRGIVAIYYSDEPVMQPLRLGMQVHDSLLVQYPIPRNLDDCHNIARVMIFMQNALEPDMEYEGRRFKIYSDFGIGMNWGDHSEDNPEGMKKVFRFTADDELKLRDAVAEYFGIAQGNLVQ